MIRKIDIVLVNWNAGRQISDALSSIASNHEGLVNTVIVVDNNSIDDSLAQIEASKADLPFSLHIVRNATNRGFGAACNQGAALSFSEYLLFLNPDTLLFANSLSEPLRYMEQVENSGVGICGIQLIDESGHVSRSCARFPSASMFAAQALGLNKLPCLRSWSHHMGDWDHASTREVDHVIGAFYLIRRDLFESLKGFDERFFVYLEDLDLSLRAHQAGWRSVYFANAQAFHAGGGTSNQIKARRLFYSLSSRLQYAFKHLSWLGAMLVMLVTLLMEPLSRSVLTLLRGSWSGLKETWVAYGMLWRWLPQWLFKGVTR